MKTSTAGKRKDVGRDTTAEVDHTLARFLQSRMIEDDQRATPGNRRSLFRPAKPTGDSAVLERDVVWAVLGKLPAEQLLEKFSCGRQVCCLKLDIINLIFRAHVSYDLLQPSRSLQLRTRGWLLLKPDGKLCAVYMPDDRLNGHLAEIRVEAKQGQRLVLMRPCGQFFIFTAAGSAIY